MLCIHLCFHLDKEINNEKCCNRLRLRAGVGVDENLPTPAPTPVKTTDSGRLRLRLRSRGHGYQWQVGRRPKHDLDPPLRPAGSRLRSTGPGGSYARLTAPLAVNTQAIVGRGGENAVTHTKGTQRVRIRTGCLVFYGTERRGTACDPCGVKGQIAPGLSSG